MFSPPGLLCFIIMFQCMECFIEASATRSAGDYHQKNANVTFNPSLWTPRYQNPDDAIPDFFAVSSQVSDEARNRIPYQPDVPYGPTERQRIDIYGAEALPKGSPVFLFIHGGYWTLGSRQASAVMAVPFFQNGIITAVMGYDLAPNVTIEKIVQEVLEAVRFMDHWCGERESRFWISGHSVGAQLAAMAMSQQTFNNLEGAILISGVLDLLPLVGTYIAEAARFGRETALHNSPQTRVPQISALNSVTFLHAAGQYDPPGILDVSKHFHETLLLYGIPSTYLLLNGVDHFNIVTNLQDSNYTLTRWIISNIWRK